MKTRKLTTAEKVQLAKNELETLKMFKAKGHSDPELEKSLRREIDRFNLAPATR